MTEYPYGTPPAWWGKGRAAAGQAAKDAIEASERDRKAGRLKPIVARAAALDGGLFEDVDNGDGQTQT